jgi:CRP/FNR family transcriptional regulator
LTAVAYQSVAADELRRLILARPEGMLRVAHLVDRERRWLEDLTIALGRCNAEQRVALLLLDLHSRLRSRKLIEATAFRLPLTQAEIGDHLGLTVVHVNRVLRSLREQAIVSISHGVATIHNLERLRGSAETSLPEERELGRQAE